MEIKDGGWGWEIKEIMEEGGKKIKRGNDPMYYYYLKTKFPIKG
jgi:hypothetical protein